jgi:hypothetical protein
MKALMIASIALVFGIGNAYAACTGNTRLNAQQLGTTFVGKTVCATLGNDKWQEEHRGSGTTGELWDYKRGPGHAVDPTARVGTWTIVGTGNSAVMQHSYTGGGSYQYQVFNNGNGTYDFCGPTVVPNARVGTIGAAC